MSGLFRMTDLYCTGLVGGSDARAEWSVMSKMTDKQARHGRRQGHVS